MKLVKIIFLFTILSLFSYANNIKLTPQEIEYIKSNPTITIANELSWKPYDFYENSKAKGYSIDLLNLISSKVGLKTEFITNSWSILINDFKRDKIDIMPVLSKNKDREKYMLFSDSYIELYHSIIIQNNQKNIQSLADLQGKKVAVIKGWNVTKVLKENYPKIKLIYFATTIEKLEAVAYGRVDATVEGFVTANYIITERFLNNLKIVSKIEIPGFNNKQYIGVRKNAPLLHSIINKSLNSLTSQEYITLNKKWQTNKKNSTLDLTFEEQEFIKNTTIKISGSKKWAPFIFTSNQEEAYGIIIDYWNLIVKKAGLNSEIKLYDVFADSLTALKNKEVDILSSGKITNRREYALTSEHFESFPLSIATLEEQSYIPSTQALLGKKIAVGKNFTSHEILKKYHPNIKLVLTKNTTEALKLVSTGEVFAAVDAAPTLIYYINSLGLNNIKISGHTGENFNLEFIIRKDYPLLKSIVNKAIKQITPQEKLKIFNQWITVNYQQEFDYDLFWKTFGVIAILFTLFGYRHLQLLRYQKLIKHTNNQLTKQSIKLEKSNEIIHETQNELENSLDNFISLVDSTIEAILITENGKVIYVNDAAIQLFKVETKISLMNKEVLTFFTKESQEDIKAILNSSETKTHEIVAKRNDDNDTFPALVKSKSLQFQNISAKTISIIDLTELKNKESLIQEQSKMVAIGEMIGNIAHQWRQPLSIISTSASAMELYKNTNKLSDEIFFRSTKNILKNTEFLSQTIDDFRNFIKTNKKYVYFNIDTAIDKTIVLIEATLKDSHIKVVLDIEKDINLHNFENELIQALLNIINNSKDVLKDKEVEDKLVFISAYIRNHKAIIEIKDTGGGIPLNAIEHIFEPYFTTKHKSIGTGLGLYMTHKIIFDSMQGTINVKNIVFKYKEHSFKGALFTISLPIDSIDINSNI